MRASLILLATTFAASVIAAPMPIQYPAESPAPLKVREVNGDAAPAEVENLKRQILERLDAIVQRSTTDEDVSNVNERRDNRQMASPSERTRYLEDDSEENYKRRLSSGAVPPSLNGRSDAQDEDTSEEIYEKRRTYDNSGVNKRRTYDNSGVNKRRTYDISGVNKRRTYDNSGVNKRRTYDNSNVNKRRTYDNSGVNKRRTYDNSGVNKRRTYDNSGVNKRRTYDNSNVNKRRTYDNSAVNRRDTNTERDVLDVDEE